MCNKQKCKVVSLNLAHPVYARLISSVWTEDCCTSARNCRRSWCCWLWQDSVNHEIDAPSRPLYSYIYTTYTLTLTARQSPDELTCSRRHVISSIHCVQEKNTHSHFVSGCFFWTQCSIIDDDINLRPQLQFASNWWLLAASCQCACHSGHACPD